MTDTSENQAIISPDWEENLSRLRSRLVPKRKLAKQLALVFVLGIIFFGSGVFFLKVLGQWLFEDHNLVFNLCSGLTFVCVLGMTLNLVRYHSLSEQLEENYLYGGRSTGNFSNRVLLQTGLDQLHVRLSGLFIVMSLIFMGCSLLFFGMGLYSIYESWHNPEAVIRGRGGASMPIGGFGLIMFTGGLPFFLLGFSSLVSGRRIDFNRQQGTLTVWNLFNRHVLPLKMIREIDSEIRTSSSCGDQRRQRTSSYYSIDLELKDRARSRIHVMNLSNRAKAVGVINDFLGFNPTQISSQKKNKKKAAILQPPTRLPTLRKRNFVVITTFIFIFGIGLSMGSAAFLHFFPLPPSTPEIAELERLIGSWKGTFQLPNGNSIPLERKAELISGEHYLRVIECRTLPHLNGNKIVKSLMFWRYEEETDEYFMWRFSERNAVTNWKGIWNSSAQQFEMQQNNGNLSPQILIVGVPIKGTQESKLTSSQNGADLMAYWTLKRDDSLVINIESIWNTDNKPEKLVSGDDLLLKRTGEWNRKEQFKGKWRELPQSTEWILGGRFIETRYVDPEWGYEQISVTSNYAEEGVLLRWTFGKEGHLTEWTGEYQHLAYVKWSGKRDDGFEPVDTWTFNSLDNFTERPQLEIGNNRFTRVYLKRVPDSTSPVIPPKLGLPPPGSKSKPLSQDEFSALTSPAGENYMTNARLSSPNGSDPKQIADGDRNTKWEVGSSVKIEFDHPVKMGRFILHHPDDRIYHFGISQFQRSEEKYQSFFQMKWNLGQITPTGEFKDYKTEHGTLFVNGEPSENYTQKQTIGLESQEMIEFQIVLPEPITTTGIILWIQGASAAPVFISEFEVYEE